MFAARDKATLQREVRDYEPEVALYGGDDGLEIYRRLIPEAERLLAPGGWLVMEIGHDLGRRRERYAGRVEGSRNPERSGGSAAGDPGSTSAP